MTLDDSLAQRILLLDGSLGALLMGDARPRTEAVAAAHRAYLDAGADIITTDTFLRPPEGRRGILQAAQLARSIADEYASLRRRFVAGSIGPARPHEPPPLYGERASALIDGGVDLLLLETFFDSHDLRTALAGTRDALAAAGCELPVMVSVTLDEAGTLRSGETPRDLFAVVADARPFSVGLNCGYGAADIRPHLEALAANAGCYVTCHPSAGLPDAFGDYDERPRDFAAHLRACAASGLLNVAGGCCGTTPEYIRALASALEGLPPRSMARGEAHRLE